jgi:hypothetical protein
MKQLAAAAFLLLGCAGGAAAQSPVNATTEDGRKVLLFPDGKWKLAATPAPSAGKGGFVRSPKATERVELLRGAMAIYVDPAKWKKQADTEDVTKTTFHHASGEAYGMIVAERLAIPLQRLKEIAITNARSAAPDAKVVFEETRHVNDIDVLVMQMEGTIQGIAFTYYGYYYSGPQGSLQVLTYTGTNLFAEYKAAFEEFLNGVSGKS